jgi:hypothetical protein
LVGSPRARDNTASEHFGSVYRRLKPTPFRGLMHTSNAEIDVGPSFKTLGATLVQVETIVKTNLTDCR